MKESGGITSRLRDKREAREGDDGNERRARAQNVSSSRASPLSQLSRFSLVPSLSLMKTRGWGRGVGGGADPTHLFKTLSY